MRTLVVFESKFGNTKQLARIIADDLGSFGPTSMVDVQEGTPSFEGIDVLVVCGPTQAHGVSAKLKQVFDEVPPGALDGVAAAAFDTRLKGPRWLTGAASLGLAKRLQHAGARLIAPGESFIVSGSEGPLAEHEVEHAHAWAAGLTAALVPTEPVLA